MSNPSSSARAALAADRRRRGLVLALFIVLAASLATAWDSDRMAAAAERLGPQATVAANALRPALQSALAMDEQLRLQAINRYVNRSIQFRDDAEVWGETDYWASPLESLSRGAGDCEDYAIAKYFGLLAVGVPVERLRLVYVRARLVGPDGGGRVQAHMVLAWYAQPGSVPLVLDNLVEELLPASQRTDLQPVFSFNSEGLWQGAGAERAGDPLQRLSRWRTVVAKARAEGFF